jgi:hypothetical protein
LRVKTVETVTLSVPEEEFAANSEWIEGFLMSFRVLGEFKYWNLEDDRSELNFRVVTPEQFDWVANPWPWALRH